MRDAFLSTVKAPLQAVKDHLGHNKPHFNFITIHYFWIIGATVVASILIYAAGRGDIDYVDALLFASGANTQAGLNTVDCNLLNTFQQVVIYVFSMASSPITLHGSVVFLRLYWFEKRFQHWVRDARTRRGTLSKSKSKARGDVGRAEEGGVQGRNITVVPPNGRDTRLTNDGIVVDTDRPRLQKPEAQGSDTSDSNTVAGDLSSYELSALKKIEESPPESRSRPQASFREPQRSETLTSEPAGALGHPPTISFADHVKRSDVPDDGRDDVVPLRRSHAEHIAILQRQRQSETENDEVLHIPGPRETERGLGPTRLRRDMEDDGSPLGPVQTWDSRAEYQQSPAHGFRGRRPTITIAEPEHRKRDDLAEDAAAVGSTIESLRMRKPRVFNRGQHRFHEDDEDTSSHTPATRVKTIDTIRSFLTRDKEVDDMPYLSYNPTMGRNSNFVGLSLEEREELGGIEYRSLRTLALVILGYFWGFQVLAFTCFVPWIRHNRHYSGIIEEDGQSPTWWAFWTSNSAFMDLGLTLTPDSMISFASSQYVLMIMAFFIIIGNTGFPVMLRFLIWLGSIVTPKGSGLWEELRFLLDHPRRCFTLLFPSSPTWWLFWILVILNVIDLVFFIVLDINAEVVTELSVATRVVNGMFQSASTRTAGFSSVPLSGLHPAMPVLYMVMMYISVFPIAISIRRTNVYEEKSLGVYHEKNDVDEHDDPGAVSYVGTHLRRQLSFDLWYVSLGFFIIAISEGKKIQEGRFDLFACLFEVISAYGTVGLSIGVSGVDASLCSQFTVVGKLVIIAMMIRGRHRGLPYGLDRAVLLPSESRFEREAMESHPVLVRTNTGRTGRTSMDARRASSLPRPRSLSRGRDHNIISSLLHPGPAVSRGKEHSHRRNTSNTSHAFSGIALSQVQSQPILDSDVESLARTTTREQRMGPRRAETEPMIVET